MPVDVTATLRTALQQLETDRDRIDQQIRAVRTAVDGVDGGARSIRASDGMRTNRRSRRRAMSAAARKAVSQRMKAYWAKRRAEKGKTSTQAGATSNRKRKPAAKGKAPKRRPKSRK